ncbi:MAG TPA: hypothetical protein VMG58_16540, partial [Candidatus Sulfotelmatobacter sp.]|nr:hypothetical protein [Candidatus Sulfotelmatobacter sp.]
MPAGAGTVAPVPLPDPQIPGFHFPESEATIVNWVYEMGNGTPADAATAFENIHLHGWGIWTALTMETAQIDTGQKLRVFETWFTPQELSGRANTALPAALLGRPRSRSALRHFNQFQHGSDVQEESGSAATEGSETVFGYVKFDPTATDHIVKEQLLSVTALNKLMQGGAQQVSPFPSTALSLKSAFQVITAQTLVNGRYFRLNAWSGPPATPRAWGPAMWPGVVWIDVRGGGSGAGQIDMQAAADGSTRTDETTYPVSSMIYHRLSALEAAQFNAEQPGAGARAGDCAVLVAMHVAGREIARWTWQTFWWTPTPENPQLPSSQVIASLRPAQLTGAARNYAMALGYEMLTPGQPNVGGRNSGLAMYTYNPYLEARFGSANLPDSLPGVGPDGQPANNNV